MELFCEECAWYMYDEDEDMYFCTVDMDEDDYESLIRHKYRSCPYYKNGDEYRMVRHQM